jgi:hypothetical protein
MKSGWIARSARRAVFLEQLIVRRELAINFVRFHQNYDRLEAADIRPGALHVLRKHIAQVRQPRPYRRMGARLKARGRQCALVRWTAPRFAALAARRYMNRCDLRATAFV